MLRSMRFTAPPERYDDLLAAANHAALELADYCVDSAPDARWPFAGDGNAAVIAVVDDNQETGHEVERSMRVAYKQQTGESAEWLTFAKSYVFLPCALEVEWYNTYGPVAEALHEAEDANDVARAAALRDRLHSAVTMAADESATNLQGFCDDLINLGVLPILAAERPLTVADILDD